MTHSQKHGSAEIVTLVITVTIKPECEQTFLDYMKGYARTVDENEPDGSVLYCLLRDVVPDPAPQTYVMLQRYRDQASYEAHREKPYRNEGLANLMSWVAKPPEFRVLSQILPT